MFYPAPSFSLSNIYYIASERKLHAALELIGSNFVKADLCFPQVKPLIRFEHRTEKQSEMVSEVISPLIIVVVVVGCYAV